MDIKDRIIQFIEYKNISANAFEKSIGVSKSYIRNTKSVSAEVVSSIIRIYSELNSEWLLMGNGSMLKSDTAPSVQLSDRSANYQGTFTEPINTIMGSGNSIGGSARERITEIKGQKLVQAKTEAIELRHENEKLKAEIEHLKMTIELQKSFIEEKERMIKILLEKK